MLVFDRASWPRHRIGAYATVASAVFALGWCVATAVSEVPWRWPGGGSLPGFTLGVLGGGIIVFEMLLWPRKLLRGWRLGRTKCWLAGHLWLGILALPLLLFHGGFHFALGRSTLAAVLMWLLVLVVLSGLWGLVMQHIYPRKMLEELPAETIYGQIGHVLKQCRAEAAELVDVTCGPASAVERDDDDSTQGRGFLVTAGTRRVGAVRGKTVETSEAWTRVPGATALRAFHDQVIAPYLEDKPTGPAPLDSQSRAVELFENLRKQVPEEAWGVVDRLAELCDQRRQFRLQQRWHWWLHGWLGLHFALSCAMFVLMIAHVVLALKFL